MRAGFKRQPHGPDNQARTQFPTSSPFAEARFRFLCVAIPPKPVKLRSRPTDRPEGRHTLMQRSLSVKKPLIRIAAALGIAALPALLQAEAQSAVPVTAVMSVCTKQADALFTTAGSGVKDFSDLVGKTIATATFSPSNVVFPLLLESQGVQPDGVKLLKAEPGALAPLLATGKFVARISRLSTVPAFQGPLKETGGEREVLPWSDLGYAGCGQSVLASDAILAKRPEAVRKFLDAFGRSVELANGDPMAAAKALKAAMPQVGLERTVLEWTASRPLILNNIALKDGFGVFEQSLLATTWRWFAEAQGLPFDVLDPARAVINVFLPGTAARSVTP